MTERQKEKIRLLRAEGYGYTTVAQMLGISRNTVKSFCRRNDLNGTTLEKAGALDTRNGNYCPCCGKEVRQNPGRKAKRFCSDKCRNAWWNSHPDQVERKAHYEFVCACCKKPFTAYGNANRKYCSRACYVADRFGGGANE